MLPAFSQSLYTTKVHLAPGVSTMYRSQISVHVTNETVRYPTRVTTVNICHLLNKVGLNRYTLQLAAN